MVLVGSARWISAIIWMLARSSVENKKIKDGLDKESVGHIRFSDAALLAEKELEAKGFSVDKKMETPYACIYSDNKKGEFCVFERDSMKTTNCIKNTEISGCELIENGIVINSVRGNHNIFKSLFFIPDHNLAKKVRGIVKSERCKSLYLCLSVKNPQIDDITVSLIMKPVDKGSPVHQESMAMADEIISNLTFYRNLKIFFKL